jgi:hypothetical protein
MMIEGMMIDDFFILQFLFFNLPAPQPFAVVP